MEVGGVGGCCGAGMVGVELAQHPSTPDNPSRDLGLTVLHV